MTSSNYCHSLIYFTLLSLILTNLVTTCRSDDDKGNDEHGLTVAELIQLRGFKAKNYYLTTSEGYILNLVKANNPLIDNSNVSHSKQVILFIHGAVTNAKCFIINSIGAHPENYAHLNASQLNEIQLDKKFGLNPNSKSLVFLALNFGHEVWLLNRRGTMYSQGHVGPNTQPFKNPLKNLVETFRVNKRKRRKRRRKKRDILSRNPLAGAIKEYREQLSNISFLSNQINPRYWNYSIDEQAEYDVPETIDFILKKTNRTKLTIVGHSLGGGIPLFALYRNPKLGNKISKALLWAPGVNQGAVPASERPPIKQMAMMFLKPLKHFNGPAGPSIFNPILKAISATICTPEVAAETLCQAAEDFIFGYGGKQQLIKSGFMTASPETISSHEMVQLIEDYTTNRTHFYNYSTPERNQIAYGQPKPPQYDFSKLTFKNLYIWYGKYDGFVQHHSIEQLIGDLRGE